MTGPHPLDRPIWNALRGPHAALAQGGALAWRYPPEIGPLAAVAEPSAAAFAALARLARAGEAVALLGREPLPPSALPAVASARRVAQMLWSGPSSICGHEAATPLGPSDVPDMLGLVARTQPGPFGPRTVELGGFLGIRHEGRLVAMAGERLRVPGFAEISGVCTDPDHRGRGHARRLMLAVAAGIRASVPVLKFVGFADELQNGRHTAKSKI